MTTEKDLIKRACRGDSAAFLPLFQKYQPIVFKNQGKYHLKDLEPEDWHQEGQLVFFKTLKSYDERRGVSLGVYFKINFERHVYSLLRRQSAEKRKIDTNVTSLEGNLEKHGEGFVYQGKSKEDVSFGYVEIRESLADLNESLSPLEKVVFHAYLSGQSTSQISQKLNVSQSKVTNALDRIKGKLKNRLK